METCPVAIVNSNDQIKGPTIFIQLGVDDCKKLNLQTVLVPKNSNITTTKNSFPLQKNVYLVCTTHSSEKSFSCMLIG